MLVSSQGSESTYDAQARTVPTQPVRPIYATCRECGGCAKQTAIGSPVPGGRGLFYGKHRQHLR